MKKTLVQRLAEHNTPSHLVSSAIASTVVGLSMWGVMQLGVTKEEIGFDGGVRIAGACYAMACFYEPVKGYLSDLVKDRFQK